MFLNNDEIEAIEKRFEAITNELTTELQKLRDSKDKEELETIIQNMNDERDKKNSEIGDLYFDVKEELGIRFPLVEKELLEIRDKSYNSTSNILMMQTHYLKTE